MRIEKGPIRGNVKFWFKLWWYNGGRCISVLMFFPPFSPPSFPKNKTKRGEGKTPGIYKYRYTSGESVIKLDRVRRKMGKFIF
jgi:hypothetical protein